MKCKFKLHELFYVMFLENSYLFNCVKIIHDFSVMIMIWKFSRIFFPRFCKAKFLLRCKNNDTFSSIIKEISRTLLPNEISMCLNFHNDGFAYFP